MTLLALSWNASAQEPALFSIGFENDLFAGSDADYTHGTRVTYLHRETEIKGRGRSILEKAPLKTPGMTDAKGRIRFGRWGFTLGQNLYTPEDIASPNLIVDDRPYAGWLYGGWILQRRDGENDATHASKIRIADHFEINVGMVGPASLAGRTQRFVHRTLDETMPNGWPFQIENEPVILIQANRAIQRHLVNGEFLGQKLESDVTAEFGFGVGNLITYANTGLSGRFGINVPDNPNPTTSSDGMRPTYLAATPREIASDGTVSANPSAYFFGGAYVRAVGRNIFLDGNTFRTSHSVIKKTFVADLRTGLSVSLSKRDTLVFWHTFRTREFDGQRRAQRFAGIALTHAF